MLWVHVRTELTGCLIKRANVSEHVNFLSGHKEQSLISRCPYEAGATRGSTVFQNLNFMKIICHRILCAFKPSVFLAFLPSPLNGAQMVTKTTVIALLTPPLY